MLQKFQKLIEPFKSGDTIPVTMVQEVIDSWWKNPENELPKDYKNVLVMYEYQSNKVVNPIIAHYISSEKKFYFAPSHAIPEFQGVKILAWSELPDFNKA